MPKMPMVKKGKRKPPRKGGKKPTKKGGEPAGFRTKKGNVTAKARKKYAVLSKGRFPIKSKTSARSALRLRGHTKSPAERRRVIKEAAKYLPEAARKAREEDAKK